MTRFGFKVKHSPLTSPHLGFNLSFMNTVLKVLVALILLPIASCGAFTCVALPIAGAYKKAKGAP